MVAFPVNFFSQNGFRFNSILKLEHSEAIQSFSGPVFLDLGKNWYLPIHLNTERFPY